MIFFIDEVEDVTMIHDEGKNPALFCQKNERNFKFKIKSSYQMY